ncbi:hypothetical protein BKA62DRAFT_667571 [Auriculariales sp. MPI-PUGE-AT-0066]|nr:hypothetical protein BKA62DRAFT_667571 [Auriculariales sp. MPI-PUGE-AT-0066]
MASTSYAVNGVNGVAGPSNGHVALHPALAPLSPHATSHGHQQAYRSNIQTIAANHNVAIVNHLANAGFHSGHYSDITLQVPWRTYAVHRLIISRSPYLAHVMGTEPSSKVVAIPLEQEPSITPEAFDIASLEAVHPANARSVLAAACLLGGMDELTNYAYQLALSSLSADTIPDWLDFLDSLPAEGDGTVFGPYAKQMREDVFHFLVISLPIALDAFPSSEVPSSPVTPVMGKSTGISHSDRTPCCRFSPQARFKFAKRAIELRKARGTTKDFEEETVVLAFGTGDANATPVHVTRRTRKKALFKVGR